MQEPVQALERGPLQSMQKMFDVGDRFGRWILSRFRLRTTALKPLEHGDAKRVEGV